MNSSYLLIEGGDLSFFRTLPGLARYVESPDIDAYLAVNSSGFRIELTAERREVSLPKFGLVSVVPVKATPTKDSVDRAVLRERLAGFLKALEVKVAGDASVEQLWETALNKVGFTD